MKSSLPATTSSMSEALRAVIKRRHFPIEIMLTCVRWYVAYPLSLRHIEEMMAERGVPVDHATIHRWSIKLIPVLAAVFKTRKLSVGSSWRMDETYIQVGGQWKYLYRAVDAGVHRRHVHGEQERGHRRCAGVGVGGDGNVAARRPQRRDRRHFRFAQHVERAG